MYELTLTVLAASWSVLGEMAPYLLLGFFFAGVLSVMISPEWVERHLGGGRFGQIFKASLFGVPLPLCSCGVLPVAASLRRHGAGKGATTAFLLSTPQTGVDSIAVTYALLGPFLAVFRPVAALITGLIGGSLVHAFERNGVQETVEKENGVEGDSCSSAGSCDDGGSSSCCDDEQQESPRSSWAQALRYGFLTLPRDIGKALVVGILISGVISALVEPNTLKAYLGGGLWPLLAAMAIGVPLYVCATASTPIALGLIHAGLSPGAALVFLISGPATNGAALTTLWRVLGRRPAMIYLVTVAICAVASGLAVDALIDSGAVPFSGIVSPRQVVDGASDGEAAGSIHDHGQAAGGLGAWLANGSAVALVLILAAALWPRRRGQEAAGVADAGSPRQESISLQVSGMRCHGCKDSLSRALAECAGVREVEIDLDRGSALVAGRDVDFEQIALAVRSLGFEITNPEVLIDPGTC